MKSRVLLFVVAAVVSMGVSGCGRSMQTSPASSNEPAGADQHADHSAHNHGDHDHDGQLGETDMDKMKAELAKLSPEDAASAEKQHVCPVSGEMLGTMGAPIKVDVNGRQVWICCEGCQDQLLENPDKFLAKLRPE